MPSLGLGVRVSGERRRGAREERLVLLEPRRVWTTMWSSAAGVSRGVLALLSVLVVAEGSVDPGTCGCTGTAASELIVLRQYKSSVKVAAGGPLDLEGPVVIGGTPPYTFVVPTACPGCTLALESGSGALQSAAVVEDFVIGPGTVTDSLGASAPLEGVAVTVVADSESGGVPVLYLIIAAALVGVLLVLVLVLVVLLRRQARGAVTPLTALDDGSPYDFASHVDAMAGRWVVCGAMGAHGQSPRLTLCASFIRKRTGVQF